VSHIAGMRVWIDLWVVCFLGPIGSCARCSSRSLRDCLLGGVFGQS